eukprot:6212048-Pleurochrysis_carterae.AAC.7
MAARFSDLVAITCPPRPVALSDPPELSNIYTYTPDEGVRGYKEVSSDAVNEPRGTQGKVTFNRLNEQQNQMQPQRGRRTGELGDAALFDTHRSDGWTALRSAFTPDSHPKDSKTQHQICAWEVWKTPVGCTVTIVALRVAARQRGACFEASYQRQNELTKQHTKQIAAEHLQAESELRELSSLHTKHDVD